MASFTLNSTVAAPIDVVFDVLTDHRSYAKLTPLRSSTLEREGEPAPNGVGAVRVLKLAGPPIREEVTEFDAPSRFAYKMLSGAPVKSHTGTVDLASSGAASTSVAWRVDSTPSIPVPAAVWAAALRPVINLLLRGVVRESERRARAGG
jgi:Polyketide cyclase / dehydrase and lipid transport